MNTPNRFYLEEGFGCDYKVIDNDESLAFLEDKGNQLPLNAGIHCYRIRNASGEIYWTRIPPVSQVDINLFENWLAEVQETYRLSDGDFMDGIATWLAYQAKTLDTK